MFPARTSNKSTTTIRQEFQELKGQKREDWVIEQVMLGLVPDFMRAEAVPGKHTRALVRVGHILLESMFECFCLGVDKDYLVCPITLETAQTIAALCGLAIPNFQISAEIHRVARQRVMMYSERLGLKKDSASMLEVDSFEQPHRSPTCLSAGHRAERILDYGIPGSWAIVTNLDGSKDIQEVPDYAHVATAVRFIEQRMWFLGAAASEGLYEDFLQKESVWR